MKTIKKKCWPEAFEKVLSGKKDVELRLNDEEISEGDTLVLEEYNPEKKEYTGRTIERKVGYVMTVDLNNPPYWSKEEIQKHGLRVFSLR